MNRLKGFFKNNIDWNLFACFFKLGLFTIGGGMAMIPIMQEKICDKYKWMNEEEVLDCIAISQSLPGVIAINMATYVGYAKKGWKGALLTTFGVILPSFIIIILVVSLLRTIDENPYVRGALEGIKAAATGLIAFAAWKMGKQTLKGAFQWLAAFCAFASIVFLEADAVWVILAGIAVGEIYYAVCAAKEGKA